MTDDVREVLLATAYRPMDLEAAIDPKAPTYAKFNPQFGYLPAEVMLRDGLDDSCSTYRYEPGGQRKMVNYSDRPCRINTYGNSFTHCQQVSDGETWQEALAAHFGEPIRNFGCGGYSVYQAYRRAVAAEATDLAAGYVVLNIYDNDHVRNLDAARWIRSAWQREFPPDEPVSLHGLPWPHLRFDPGQGQSRGQGQRCFVERPGLCRTVDDLRALADPERFYEAFKDDEIVHLFVLTLGKQAPTGQLEAVAEALGVAVDLRDPATRQEHARKLHQAYGFRSTEYVVDHMRAWAADRDKKLMILLSYGPPRALEFLEDGSRFDETFLDYLRGTGLPYVDTLTKIGEDYAAFGVSPEEYLRRLYIAPAGAAVFGHHSPAGNHTFALWIKDDLLAWLAPKPPAYRR